MSPGTGESQDYSHGGNGSWKGLNLQWKAHVHPKEITEEQQRAAEKGQPDSAFPMQSIQGTITHTYFSPVNDFALWHLPLEENPVIPWSSLYVFLGLSFIWPIPLLFAYVRSIQILDQISGNFLRLFLATRHVIFK